MDLPTANVFGSVVAFVATWGLLLWRERVYMNRFLDRDELAKIDGIVKVKVESEIEALKADERFRVDSTLERLKGEIRRDVEESLKVQESRLRVDAELRLKRHERSVQLLHELVTVSLEARDKIRMLAVRVREAAPQVMQPDDPARIAAVEAMIRARAIAATCPPKFGAPAAAKTLVEAADAAFGMRKHLKAESVGEGLQVLQSKLEAADAAVTRIAEIWNANLWREAGDKDYLEIHDPSQKLHAIIVPVPQPGQTSEESTTGEPTPELPPT